MRKRNIDWLGEVIRALQGLGGKAKLRPLYDYIRDHHKNPELLTQDWENTVRQTLYDNSSDGTYRTRKNIFYSVGRKGSGEWGLRPEYFKISKGQIDDEHYKVTPISPTKAIDLVEPPARITVEINRIIRDTKLSKELKVIYNNECQICNFTIELAGRNYSEVHHLQPLGGEHDGPDTQSNMIVVCPNHHVQLDYGAIAIEPETFSIIDFDGSKIARLSLKKEHQLDSRYIEYHYKNIFLGYKNL